MSDIEYLKSYIEIVEDYIGGGESLEESEKLLNELNSKYTGELKKDGLPGARLARDYGDDGGSWVPSEICW